MSTIMKPIMEAQSPPPAHSNDHSPTIQTAATATTHRPTFLALNTKSSSSASTSTTLSSPSPASTTSRKFSRSQPKANNPTLNTSLKSPTLTTTRTFPASFTSRKASVTDPSHTSLGGYGPNGTPTSPASSDNRKFSAFGSPISPVTGAMNAETGFLATVRGRNASVISAASPTAGSRPPATFVRRQSNVAGKVSTTMTYSNFADEPASAVASSSSIDGRLAAATSHQVQDRAKKGPTVQVTEIVAGGVGIAPGREEIAMSPVVRELRGSVASVGSKNGEGKRRGSTFLLTVKEYIKPGSPSVA